MSGTAARWHAPAAVAHAFCVTRLAADRAFSYGAVPAGVDVAAILRRQTEP